jgi:hypothetical protein
MGLRWLYGIGFSENRVEISVFNIIDYLNETEWGCSY